MSRDGADVGAVWRLLSETYGWTPQEIARMTPAQVAAYMEQHDASAPPGASVTHQQGRRMYKFTSVADAQRYRRSKKGAKHA